MADVSIVVDVPLMHTIAQASATFIAILAGFYTAKVLSIASDKNRLAAKIREIQNEVTWRRNNVTEINERVSTIDNERDEDFIKSFRDYIVGKTFDSIPTADELIQELRRYADEVFTENLQRILEKQIPSIIGEIKEHKEALSSGMHYVRIPKSDTELQTEAMDARDKIKYRNELFRESEREQDKASFLETQLNDLRREFKSLAFPKYIKFGFISFIAFAILGVIFPLTYGFWGEYLLENTDMMFLIFHANNIALLLFCIGLILTFAYIGLELRHALESKALELTSG